MSDGWFTATREDVCRFEVLCIVMGEYNFVGFDHHDALCVNPSQRLTTDDVLGMSSCRYFFGNENLLEDKVWNDDLSVAHSILPNSWSDVFL